MARAAARARRKALASGRPRKTILKFEVCEVRVMPGAMFTDTAPTVEANLKLLDYHNPLLPDVPQVSTSWNNGNAGSPAPAFRYEYAASPQMAEADSSSGFPAGASSRGPAATEFIATPSVNLLPEMEPPPGAAPMPGPSLRFQFGGGGFGQRP